MADVAAALLILMAASVVSLACCAWAGVCDKRTYRQRGALIEEISLDAKRRIANKDFETWKDNYDLFETTTYGQHFWSLFCLRDPKTIYPQQLHTFFRRERDSTLSKAGKV